MGTLAVIDVSKKFGSFAALDNISVEAAQGEFLTLLGPSGCGKSTLLSIIAGLDHPTDGKILIDGADVSRTLARDRDIAMIFQSYALYPNMTVRGNIEFGLKMRGTAKPERAAAVAQVAELLHISHLLGRKPYQLSGGQRQRVAMGRALVRNPKLFLFDEPLSNLDAQLRLEMRVEIKRLHQKLGATIVYVTHDQVEAMTMSTKIVVMDQGKIVQTGTPAEIYDRPNSLFVARFVGSPPMNLIAGRVADSEQRKVLHVDAAKLPLPAAKGLISGQEITLGIRPETIVLGDNGKNHFAFDATAEVLEPTGSDLLVVFNFAGKEITSRLPPNTKIRPSDKVLVSVPLDGLHVFDTATGLRLN